MIPLLSGLYRCLCCARNNELDKTTQSGCHGFFTNDTAKSPVELRKKTRHNGHP